MNYEEVARKIEKEFGDAYYFSLKSDGAGGYLSYELAEAIAAALRLAANEAAWDGFCTCMCQVKEHEAEDCLENRIASKYGPRPEGGTR